MSFSSETKNSLSSQQIERACCLNAFERGKSLCAHERVCESCDAFFIRGVFIRTGYMSDPKKRCELTLTFEDEGCAAYSESVLCAHGLQPKRGTRNGKRILYYKMREQTEDFFTFIGAGGFTLKLIEASVFHELRRDANRISNAETANLDRSARACALQLAAIRRLISSREYQKLPAELKEAAEVRLEHADESLEELRQYFSAPISKSGIKHRFERIAAIADALD